MKALRSILRFFSIRKTFRSLFSDAVSEGIKDTFKEMGYHRKDHDTA